MSVFVDTGVWSRALRRDLPSSVAKVRLLIRTIEAGEPIVTAGFVLQALLQGFPAQERGCRFDRFSAIPLLVPNRDDHIDAAGLRNRCRRAGVQIGTIDALLAQLCVRHDLTMLTTGNDFRHAAGHCPLKLWQA